jgi:predicted dehydrogenase
VFACSTCHFHQLNVDNGVEDLASMTLEFEGGMVGTIALGRIGLASHPSGGEIKLRIVGSRGAMIVHEARPEVGVYYRNQPAGEARQIRVAGENDFLLADHFIQSLDSDRQPFMNFEDSLRAFDTVQAALQSCRCGQPVEV